MNEIDEILSRFREDIDSDDNMVDRVARAAATRVEESPSTPASPSRARTGRRPRLLAPVAAGAFVAVAAAVAGITLFDGGSGPSLVERAEAAIAPPNRILRIVATGVETNSTVGTDGSRQIVDRREFTMKDWSLRGPGQSMQMRRLISEAPEGKPPTDEDSVILRDATGTLVDLRSWVPDGTLRVGFTKDDEQFANTMAGVLRNAYSKGVLREAGKTDDGSLRLVGKSLTGPATEDGCETTEVLLDPESFKPRRMVMESGCTPQGAESFANSMVLTFEATEELEVTAETRKALEIGPWPVATRQVIGADGKAREVPANALPAPPVVEGLTD